MTTGCHFRRFFFLHPSRRKYPGPYRTTAVSPFGSYSPTHSGQSDLSASGRELTRSQNFWLTSSRRNLRPQSKTATESQAQLESQLQPPNHENPSCRDMSGSCQSVNLISIFVPSGRCLICLAISALRWIWRNESITNKLSVLYGPPQAKRVIAQR